jgi:hypothetical protein
MRTSPSGGDGWPPAAQRILFLVPYAAVLIGLHALHSAWSAVLIYHAAIVPLVLRNRSAWRSVRSGWPPAAGIGLSLLCAAGGPVLILLWPWMARDPHGLQAVLQEIGLVETPWILFCIYYGSVHPLLEEVFWRGCLASPARGPAAADLWFAGYHGLVLPLFMKTAWVAVTLVVLALASWAWRTLSRRYGGLAIPVISHALAGAGIIAAAIHLSGR